MKYLVIVLNMLVPPCHPSEHVSCVPPTNTSASPSPYEMAIPIKDAKECEANAEAFRKVPMVRSAECLDLYP